MLCSSYVAQALTGVPATSYKLLSAEGTSGVGHFFGEKEGGGAPTEEARGST